MTPPPTDASPAPTPPPLDILYRDDHYIAIHKPSGLLVHRSPIDRRETRFAIQELRDQIGQHVYPCHRIDRPTSGLLLFGLDQDACTAASILFQERKVAKTYLALVRGHPPESGTMDTPLAKYKDKDGMIKSDETQEASTPYRRLATTELPFPTKRYATTRFSLLELKPETGRRHQIRRHLAHVRYPIIGDTRHGCGQANKQAREHFQIDRLMLAATQLTFEHPYTHKTITLDCPLAPRFQQILATTRLQAL